MLNQLSLNNLRNLSTQTLNPSPDLNLIYGKNGSGKSSILEAIYLLGRGRSCRTHLLKQLVTTNQQSLMVVGKLTSDSHEEPTTIGVSYDKTTKSKIRINGKSIKSSAQLAEHFPLLFIGSNTGRLLSSGERQRRRCLDWGVFHVEPLFLASWKRYNIALKQRNASLRSNVRSQTSVWDNQLSSTGAEISSMRFNYIEQLRPYFFSYLEQLLGSSVDVSRLSFEQGWSKTSESLEIYLQDNYVRDLQSGYTRQGPHRADIKLDISHGPLASFGSGGQQKLVTCALLLSQVALYGEKMSKRCVILVDDLPAELDKEFRKRFINLLLSLDSQIFVTGTETDLFELQGSREHKMFHVEHGEINEIPSSNSLSVT